MPSFGIADWPRRIAAWWKDEPLPEEKLVQLAITGSIPFLTYQDPKEGETPAMRDSYRKLTKEPIIRACIDTLIQGIASLDFEVKPASDSPRDHEIAEFCHDAITNSVDGLVGVIESIFYNSYVEGYSVSEKIWKRAER